MTKKRSIEWIVQVDNVYFQNHGFYRYSTYVKREFSENLGFCTNSTFVEKKKGCKVNSTTWQKKDRCLTNRKNKDENHGDCRNSTTSQWKERKGAGQIVHGI